MGGFIAGSGYIEGYISIGNSTTDTLLADGVFTGRAINVTDYAIIYVTTISDVASAENGLSVQQSSDGTNWDHTDEYTIDAGSGKTFSFQGGTKYLRVVYTNGGTGQGYIRLQTLCKSVYGKPSSHRLQDTIKNDDDVELVKSVLSVQTNDENTYKNVDVQNPLPSDGDSVYAKDLDLGRTIDTNWVAVNDGGVGDLFGDVTKGLTYTGTDNPKLLTIGFQRAVITTGGMGLVTTTGSFSNVKLIAVQADGTESTLIDYTADNTDRTILPLQFAPTGFNTLRLEFHTTDDITITNIFIPKAGTVIARIQGTSDLDGFIENISSYRNALNVNPAYVHRKIVNETFHQHTGTTTNPSSPISEGDTTISVDSVAGLAVGSEIKIEEDVAGIGIQEIGLLTITDITALVITVDRPIGNPYTVAADINEVISNMAVAGTLSSPEIFEIDPPTGTIWQFTRLLISITSTTAMDDAKFGGISALTNGVSLRATTSAGRTVVFANWKANSDMILDMYNIEYSAKAPAGSNGLKGRWTFTEAEVVAELDGDASPIQKLEVLIQDTLTGNTTFYIRGQGRVFSP